jgi:DNA-binding NtrC family response regulator
VARILLIDDEEMVRNLLRMMIERHGHEVSSASNGEDGLRLLRTGDFDVVVTDLFMDDKDGISTIMDMKKAHDSTPIIAISGGGWASGVDYLDVARKMGVAYAFSKPLDRAEFLKAIDSLVGEQDQT